MGQAWPGMGEDLHDNRGVLDGRTNTLRSNFSGTSWPTDDVSEGQTSYNTTTGLLGLRKSDAYVPLNAIIENRLFYKNLVITNNATTPATQLDISADFISCNGYAITSATTWTLDAGQTQTADEANKRDSATGLVADTWYFIYLIVDTGASEPLGQSPTFATILSTNSTTPTLTSSGYDKFVRIGAVRTLSGAATFREFQQTDNVVFYTDGSSDTDTNILSTATPATSFTDLTIAQLGKSVPNDGTNYFSRKIFFYATKATSGTINVRPNNSPSTNGVSPEVLSALPKPYIPMPIAKTGLEYKASTQTQVDLYVAGYVDII
ncbi:MAG: hypothetical protein ACE5HR_00205 [bacterium]